MATNTPDIITIQRREEAQTKSGRNAGSTYLRITDTTGRKLFCFDSTLFGPLVQGATVEITTEWSKDGESERINNALPTANGHAPAASVVPSLDREQSIRRQVALKCAMEIVCATVHLAESKADGETVLSYARLFADWLENGDESPF